MLLQSPPALPHPAHTPSSHQSVLHLHDLSMSTLGIFAAVESEPLRLAFSLSIVPRDPSELFQRGCALFLVIMVELCSVRRLSLNRPLAVHPQKDVWVDSSLGPLPLEQL